MKIILENRKYILHLLLTLLIITAAVALLLSSVNAVTVDRIAELERQAKADAMAAVMPDTEIDPDRVVETENAVVRFAMRDGKVVGYCVETEPSGFGGGISMIVGVDTGFSVTGVSIISLSETPGLGMRAENPEFLEQYVGLRSGITLGGGDNSIDALSAATITSKAVTLGVNNAIDAAEFAAANIGE